MEGSSLNPRGGVEAEVGDNFREVPGERKGDRACDTHTHHTGVTHQNELRIKC